MADMPAAPAADETARRDEALSNACIDEYMHQPEVGPLEGAAPLDHPSATQAEQWWPNPGEDPVASFGGVSVSYSGVLAVADVSFPVPRGSTVALIGPSGSGKSTLLRCLDRMNDLVPGCRVEGDVRYRGMDLYAPGVDPVAVRTRIGLVFQKANPFPKSIFDNVAYGPRTVGFHGDIHDIVERALRRAALWGEVKDRLPQNALALSGGQQQRLVIARALAIDPDILLMDEPGIRAGSDQHLAYRGPDARTHAGRNDRDRHARPPAGPPRRRLHAFLTSEPERGGALVGRLVEFGTTEKIFSRPADERTEAYVSGRFG